MLIQTPACCVEHRMLWVEVLCGVRFLHMHLVHFKPLYADSVAATLEESSEGSNRIVCTETYMRL